MRAVVDSGWFMQWMLLRQPRSAILSLRKVIRSWTSMRLFQGEGNAAHEHANLAAGSGCVCTRQTFRAGAALQRNLRAATAGAKEAGGRVVYRLQQDDGGEPSALRLRPACIVDPHDL